MGVFVDGGEDTVESIYCGEDTVVEVFFFFSFLAIVFAVVVVVEDVVVDVDVDAAAVDDLFDFLFEAVVVAKASVAVSAFKKYVTS